MPTKTKTKTKAATKNTKKAAVTKTSEATVPFTELGKGMALTAPVLGLQTRSLGQDVYDMIISNITDKPTLYSWQRVNRDCYHSATPLLYSGGPVTLSNQRQLCAFVSGMVGSDPETRLLPPKHQVFNGLTKVNLTGSSASNGHFVFAGTVDKLDDQVKARVFEICFAKRGASHFRAMEKESEWWQEAEHVATRGVPLTTVLDKDIVVSFSTAYPGPDERYTRSYGVLHFCLYEPHSQIGTKRKKIQYQLK